MGRDGVITADASSLTGFTVAITASRRVDEFATMLRRRGADVVAAAAIEMAPLADDERLRAATEDVIAMPPDILIATTGIGFRGWIAAAGSWGVAEALLDALRGARVISRGPKATGALRAAGLREEWTPPSESSEEVLAHLKADDLDGKRVAVQLHGATDHWNPVPGFRDTLAGRGATVVAVPVYHLGAARRSHRARWFDREDSASRRRRHHVYIRSGGGVIPAAGRRAAAHQSGNARPDHDGDTVLCRAGDRAAAGKHRGVVSAAGADATGVAWPASSLTNFPVGNRISPLPATLSASTQRARL